MRTTGRPIPALLAAIAAAAVATTGCKKTAKPPPEPAEEEEPASSGSANAKPGEGPRDWTLDEMKTVTTSSPVEAITVYAEELDSRGTDKQPAQMAVYGTPCSQVTADPTSCQKLSEIVGEQRKAKRTAFVVVRRADRFEVMTDPAALRALLGEIDTPLEAQLLASFAGGSDIWSPQCTGFTRTIVMTKAKPSGYAMTLEKRVRKGRLTTPDGGESCSDCIIVERREAVVRPNGAVELTPPEERQWVRPMGCGRSPGWSCASAPPSRARTAGDYLAWAAHLEAASVAAFERIGEELEMLGAPHELVTRSRLAANEEREHARVLAELARAYGAEPIPFTMSAHRLRDAFELALDNATEGCVNETFGALVLHVQALTAEDVAARRAFASIAEDESRHAELSRDLADWLDVRLSPTERDAVRRASDDARRALLASVDAHAAPLADEPDRRRLGLPDAATQRALLAGLEAALV